MILAVYADDSADLGRKQLFTVGGFIGWPIAFFEAERRWEAYLRSRHLAYFKAAECHNLKGQFAPDRLRQSRDSARAFADTARQDLGDIIAREKLCGVALSLDMEAFRKLLIEDPLSETYFLSRDPYVYMFLRFMIECINRLDADLPEFKGIPIAFVFDDHSGRAKAEAAYRTLRDNPRYADRLATISHADDKKAIPLQMADLCAYEARFQTLQSKGLKQRRPPFARMANEHVFYSFALLTEDALREELRRAKLCDD